MARHINFENIENFRELGGYETPYGETACGVLYRSAVLSDATENDIGKIKKLGIRSVIDFRTPEIAEAYPDKTLNISGINTVQICVNGNGRIANDFDDMIDSYMEMFEDPENAREVLQAIAYAEKPAVIHCTAGKDRTGAYSMLILWANGVSFEDISADYLLSFPYLPKLYQKAVTGERKIPLCVMEPNSHFMPALIDRFISTYGSPLEYFEHIQLDKTATSIICNLLHKQEKSCGAVVFHEGKVLVEHMKQGHYSIPKGHVEPFDKDEVDTAKREIREETNLEVEVDSSDSYFIYYSPFEGAVKKVVFFIAEASSIDTIAQPEEVKDILWLEPEDALKILTHKSDKDVLAWAINKKAL